MRNDTANKKLIYENVNEALTKLNAQDRGRYFLCTCPECQKDEAFIYKNNMNFIQCNRENHCGERMILQFKENISKKDMRKQIVNEEYPELTKKQAESLDWADRAFKYAQRYFESKTLDVTYRGITKDVSRRFIADFQNENLVAFMFKKIEPLLGKDYSNNNWMKKRNLVFPLRGDDGHVERVLLRSSIDPDLEPKEIQLIVNPSKDTRDFFVDIPKQAKTLVISEAILDGISFREIDKNIGLLALTGSRKTRKIKEYIQKNKQIFKNKKVILSMDNDIAGWKANQDIMELFEKENIDYQLFLNPENIKDPNEFLNENPCKFEYSYKQAQNSFLLDHRDLVDLDKNNEAVVVCASRLDAISFRTVDSNIGLIALGSNKNQKNVLSSYIIENEHKLRGKKIVLALPNDKKGYETTKELTDLLNVFGVEHQTFNYPPKRKYRYVKSPFDYSKMSDKHFKKSFQAILSKFKKRNRQNTKKINKQLER